MKNNISNEHIEKIITRANKDQKFRIALATQNHFWFFMFYFSHYLKYQPANFHRELFRLSEMAETDLLVATAFRGSGKSSVMSLSLPIWAVVGKLHKKFVVLSSQTQPQVKQIYDNIKEELENNQLLINDFGPFVAKPWNDRTLKVLNYDAQILPVSLGSEIRGIRKRADRPDLVILDDIDSIASIRSQDRRKKTVDWFDRDVRQIGDKNTKFVVIGNLLHEECLVAILRKKILDGSIPGVYREYPLLDEKGKCIWPAKFPTEADIDKLRKSVINESTWLREYLLKVFNDATRVLNLSEIDFYDDLPVPGDGSRHVVTIIAIDPSLGEKETSDCTAIVSGDVYRKEGRDTLYISPHYINKRLKPAETVEIVSSMFKSLRASGKFVVVFVENVGFQRLLANQIRDFGVTDVREISPEGKDKRSRLELASPYIVNKQVRFPRNCFDEPISQVLNVGIGGMPDDIADAIIYAIAGFTKIASMFCSDPIVVKSSGLRSVWHSNGEDWADLEDRNMFRIRKVVG